MARNAEVSHLTYKIVLMGDQYSGKSSIINRYITGRYNPSYIQTIGSEYEKRRLVIEDNPVLLYIYDTMGQPDMKTIIRSLYRDAQGIILVFDFSRPETLDHIKDWIDLIETYCEILPQMLLVGNKVDLNEFDRQVTSKEAKTLFPPNMITSIRLHNKPPDPGKKCCD